MAERYWIETLGCPKNQVDSEKLGGMLAGDGLVAAAAPEEADLVVVNTCAFVEAARQESIETILALADARRDGARLVVTGCLAERVGDELAAALPEIDAIAPFGVALRPTDTPGPVRVDLRTKPDTSGRAGAVPSFDLLNLPRPPAAAPWAYVKVAEGCDRHCGFCAIPSFRGKQRSRPPEAVLAEIEALGAEGGLREAVLVAQDLASYGLDRSGGDGADALDAPVRGRRPLVDLIAAVATRVQWTRLLYLYPSALDDALVDAVLATGVPYFDLSLQHVSRPLLHRMRRWGDGDRFLQRIGSIRSDEPSAAFRSSFIVGYPGETEDDHDRLLEWLAEARLDWVGFFPFSLEDGTHAANLDGRVQDELVAERLRECGELQDAITAAHRDQHIGTTVEVLIDRPGEGRTVREAPEIDGIVTVPDHLPVGSFAELVVTGSDGTDLVALPLGDATAALAPVGAAP